MTNILDLISLPLLDFTVKKFVDSLQLVPSSYIDHLGETIFLENNLTNKTKCIGINLDADKKVASVYIEGQYEEKYIKLPNSLKLDDNIQMVTEKLKSEPFLNYTNASDDIPRKFILTYIQENLSFVIGFDKHKKMITFSVSELDDYIKNHFAWKESLKEQKLNNSVDVVGLKKQSPLERWNERLKENENYRKTNNPEFIEDYWYTATRLNDLGVIMDGYLASLHQQCVENNPSGVESVLKDCLIKINDFNQEINMIETDEREELCPYFDSTLKATGITFPEGFDPTLVYRDW